MPGFDSVTRNYISQPHVFADIFNYLAYKGERVIESNLLAEADSRLTVVLPTASIKGGAQEGIRDVLNRTVIRRDGRQYYLLLGIENQTQIDYGMPARVFLYDALEYNHMMDLVKSRCKPYPADVPFTSSLPKDCRLSPVITAVVYFGLTRWDGPMTMHDMLDIPDDSIRQLIPDYPLNIIEAAFLSEEELRRFRSDFSLLGGILKCAHDKEKMKKLFERNKSYQRLDCLTAQVVSRLTNTNLTIDNNIQETVDMCKAFDDMREEGREEGMKNERADNILRTIHFQMEKKKPFTDIVECLTGVFGVSEGEAENWISKAVMAR